ncbi:MAG: hypothetical protein WBB45_08570 [Cyclobacteriaceae bacterium]
MITKRMNLAGGYRLRRSQMYTLVGGTGETSGGTTGGDGGGSGEPDPPPLPIMPDDMNYAQKSHPNI